MSKVIEKTPSMVLRGALAELQKNDLKTATMVLRHALKKAFQFGQDHPDSEDSSRNAELEKILTDAGLSEKIAQEVREIVIEPDISPWIV